MKSVWTAHLRVNRPVRRSSRYCSVAAALLLVACSDMSLETAGADYDDSANGYYGDSDAAADASQPGTSQPTDQTEPPPEEEEDPLDLQAPRASQSFVFVANTTLNTVVRIDSVTLEVKPIEVCIEPTLVRTLPTMDRAVALCQGDDQIAVVDVAGDDDAVRMSWIAQSSNSMILSPLGDYALVWFDEGAVEDIRRAPGNPHDLTLVRLGEDGETAESYLLSVGFGIRAIQFDNQGETAFVTTDDGLSIIDMDSIDRDQFVQVLSLGDDPLERAADREVIVTGSGELAFVRSSDFSGLRVLDVEEETLSDIDLPGVPTDLDLFSDGESGIAVMRDIQSVAILQLPDALEDDSAIEIINLPDTTIGLAQLHESTNEVLLYSTVTDSDRLTVLQLEDGGHQTFALRKPIVAVRQAPNGGRALVFHSSEPGAPVPGEPVDSFIAKSEGYSLFDIGSGSARLVLSPTEADDVVFTETGEQAFIMLDDRSMDIRALQWVNFATFRTEMLELAKPPESIGVVPATGRIFVSQLADTGRITFIDTETGSQQHVTAYQLNRRIE